MDRINFIYANINSYASKKHLIHYFAQTNNIDCIMCVETKLRGNTTPLNSWEIIQQNGNVVNANIRGGSLVQANSNLKLGKANPPVINNNLNSCLHFTIPFQANKLHVFLVYIHPTSPIDDTIFTKAALYEYSVIIGDLNPDARKKQQIDFFTQNSNFVRIKTPPTFIMANNPSSTPDVILCTKNIKNNINTVLTPDLGSDHLAILWSLDIKLPPQKECIGEIRYNLEKCNMDVVNREMQTFLQVQEEMSEPFIEKFNKKLTEVVQQNSPKFKNKFFNYDLPPFIIALIKKKRQLYRHIKQNDNSAELKRQFNVLNKNIHKLISNYKQNKWVKCCDNINRMQGRNYWSEIKKLTKYKTSTSSIPTLEQGNRFYDKDNDKANVFSLYYANLYKKPSENNLDEQTQTVNNWFERFFQGEIQNNIQIEDAEYLEVLCSGQNTSPGIDNINRKVLRKLNPEIHKKVKEMYSFCLSNALFPKAWKKGIVINIPKPQTDHSRVENFRPITLLPVIGKNFEKIIRNRITKEINHRIPKHQFGFKHGHSTVHPLTILTSNIQSANIVGLSSAAVFLDIKKAFDSVWHRGILYKLYQLQCPTYLIWIVKFFLEDRENIVRVNGTCSAPFSYEQGTPQGSPLSPLLYNVFCYDIFPLLNQVLQETPYIIQFADDTCLVSHHKNPAKAVQGLQVALNTVIDWFHRWKLKVNPGKTQFIIFHHKITNASPTIELLNHQVHPQQHVKYLGITFDNKLNFKQHLTNIKRKMITRSKHFRCLTYRNSGISMKTACHIYKMLCRPMVEYAQIIFGACRRPALSLIEIAERTCLRTITKMRHPANPLHNPSNDYLYEKTKIVPILQRFDGLTRRFTSRAANITKIEPFILSFPQNYTRKRQYPEKTIFQILTNT